MCAAESRPLQNLIQMQIESFPSEVIEKLQWYVYRLIDPRNGETFYVGKGKGNRVFAHARAQLPDADIGDKLKRIREIQIAGFEVSHVIHRHGMIEEKTAFEVEAALMDAYPGLTNVVGGAGSLDFGVMHAEDIMRRYAAQEAAFEHRALLIKVNRSATEASLYEATRFAWRVSLEKAKEAEVVLAVLQGLIVGAFVADDWLSATTANFPGRESEPTRFGFVGREASDQVKALYVNKRIPDRYRKRGAASPVRYTW
ncbi:MULTISPECIES: hypothetical protein [Massilia]|uniref:GIY-YIG domain-containing protein n=1 Tax=Massilia timonae CCUG 45783 TaxID=883126 RepID=K9E0M6_9BURK|nr:MULTISPECIES: hypothetical protein [Massilia]EKU84402.1 hypothetical protein HMPREF9710_00304 [Massilia timonae CCUG 45783]QYG00829.1 hypothetical protein KY496_21045 [Massilia sp. NP310]